jgi:Holliday junction resolvase
MGAMMMDGTEQERHLLNCLSALGWEGIRSPASGTQPEEAPDVLAASGGVVICGELKSGGPPRNPTGREVTELQHFGDQFDAASVIVARWKGDRSFYLAPPEALDQTPGGNYSIPGDPSRWPFSACIHHNIDAGDGDPRAEANVYQDDIPDDAVGDRPLRCWVQTVAQAQPGTIDDGR